MSGKAKYTKAEIKQHIRELVIKQKRDKRIPARSQLAKRMEVTTRTLWNYRDKYPDIFKAMDIEAIKMIIGRGMNAEGYKVESTLRTVLQHYKPYFNTSVVLEELPKELEEVIHDPLKRALLKLGQEVGMQFKIN